jgi:hypothetical protein
VDRDSRAGVDVGKGPVQVAAREDSVEDREPDQPVEHRGIVGDKGRERVAADSMSSPIAVDTDIAEDTRARRMGVAEVPRLAVADTDSVEQKDLDTFDNPYIDYTCRNSE